LRRQLIYYRQYTVQFLTQLWYFVSWCLLSLMLQCFIVLTSTTVRIATL